MKIEYEFPKEEFSKIDFNRFILAVDVGATHTYIAIMAAKNNKEFKIILKHKEETNKMDNLSHILNESLRLAKEIYDIEVSIACIGAAGPISRRRSYIYLTNTNLMISKEEILKNTLLKKVILLNNFEALGYGLDFIDLEKDTINLPHTINNNTDEAENSKLAWSGTSPRAIIGAGTGLGMSICHYDFNKHLRVPTASEGGHIDYTPYSEEEHELVEFLKREKSIQNNIHPELERVLSREGLENIYNFLSQNSTDERIKHINIHSGKEKLLIIEENYYNIDICKKTLDLFFNIYARATRYLALISECYAGIFITGGIAQKNIKRLKDPSFMEEFEKHDKRFEVLKKIPIYIVTNNDITLYGCCNVAINFFNIL